MFGCTSHTTLSVLDGEDGAPVFAACSGSECASGLRFQSADGRVRIAAATELDFTDHFTLEAWIYPHTTAAGEMLWCKSAANGEHKALRLLGAELVPSATLAMTGGPSPVALEGGRLPLARWTHVAMSLGGGVLTLYVGGAPFGSMPRADAVLDGDGALYLGACPGEPWLPGADVSLSDLRFSRVARYSEPFTPEPVLQADELTVALYPLNRQWTNMDLGPHAMAAALEGTFEWVDLPNR